MAITSHVDRLLTA